MCFGVPEEGVEGEDAEDAEEAVEYPDEDAGPDVAVILTVENFDMAGKSQFLMVWGGYERGTYYHMVMITRIERTICVTRNIS